MTYAALAVAVVALAALAWLWFRVRDVTRAAVADFERWEQSVGALNLEMARIGRMGERLDDYSKMLDALHRRIEGLARVRPRVEMSEEQRRQLEVMWAQVACGECGYAHPGTCTRVKARTVDAQTDAGGRVLATRTTVEYWPNDEWTPPEGSITSLDVWGVPVPIPPVEESTAGA